MSRQLYRQSLLLAVLVGVAALPCFALGQTADRGKKRLAAQARRAAHLFRRP